MNLPVLPMGTLMGACMLLGAIGVATTGTTTARGAAGRALAVLVGALSLAAAAWQLGWYFPRHPTETWGLAALGSGALLLAGGAWCVSARARRRLPAARWPVAVGLGGFALLYAVAIARL